MKPLVSVIIPVYNISEYVTKCLESVVLQSYENLEIIVVDDGSTDESGKICDKIALKDSRLKVYHRKNGGLSSARNFGISKAHGEYVALVDGDDFVKKDFVKAMVIAVEETGAEVVVCGFDEFVTREKVLSGKEAAIKLLVEQENMEIVAWNKLYRRELFDGIEYPVGEKHEDNLTTYKILAKAEKVAYVSKSLYSYVKRPGSIMNEAKLVERLSARYKAAEEAVKYFRNNKELRQAAEVAVLTSKYAFMDAAVKKEISQEYYALSLEWIKKHKNELKNNKFMTKKLKLYNFLNSIKLYKVFRTII